MTEGVWKDSKATGKMEGNKLVVETTMPTGMQWHDEWEHGRRMLRRTRRCRRSLGAGNGGVLLRAARPPAPGRVRSGGDQGIGWRRRSEKPLPKLVSAGYFLEQGLRKVADLQRFSLPR